MSSTVENVEAAAPPATDRPEHELICSEVWGGNRAVETDVKLPGLAGALYSSPCHGPIGGDIHYLSACGAGLIARILIADVAGHGAQVSEISQWLYESLRKHMNRPNPSRIFEELNERAVGHGISALTTAACLTYYSHKGRVRFCYAGHHPVLHYRHRLQRWETLSIADGDPPEPRNIPLGVEAGAVFDVGELSIEDGDRLLLCSDGVLETARPDGELFGQRRLVELLNAYHELALHTLARRLIHGLSEFASVGALTHDDVTFLLLEARDRPRGPAVWSLVKNRARKLRQTREK